MLYSSPLLLLVSLFASANCFVIPANNIRTTTAAATIVLTSTTRRTPALYSTAEAPQEQQHQQQRKAIKNGKPLITVIESTEDYLNFLGQDERLCVVKFYASWCKSCQRFGVKYQRLASQEGDLVDPKTGKLLHSGNVRFAEIEFGANARLCRTLGIKRLPNIHLYKGKVGRLAAFACGPQKFPILEEKLGRFLSMSDEELELEKTMEEGSSMADQIVTELQKEHYEAALEDEGGKKVNSKATP